MFLKNTPHMEEGARRGNEDRFYLLTRFHIMRVQNFSIQKSLCYFVTVTFLLLLSVSIAGAQTTAFTDQGRLSESGNSISGNFDFQFKLYDALSGGIQQGSSLTRTNTSVTEGIFTVTLDFGVCPSC